MPPISSFRRVVFDVHPKPCRGEESQDGHGEHGEVFRDDGERGGNHQAQRGSRAQEKRDAEAAAAAAAETAPAKPTPAASEPFAEAPKPAKDSGQG